MAVCRTTGEDVPAGFTFEHSVFCPWHAMGRWLPRCSTGTYDQHREARISDEDTIIGRFGQERAEQYAAACREFDHYRED